MLKYLLILLAMIVFAGWVLYAWYKRQGVKGMATSTGQGLGILATAIGAAVLLFGKLALIFVRLGKTADDDTSTQSNLSTPLVFDSDTFDAEGCFKDEKGNIYL